MRQVRELADHDSSVALCDALSASGFEVRLSETQRGTFTIWIIDEAQLPRAQELTKSWLDDGDTEAFAYAAGRGRAARELIGRIEERRQRYRQVLAERMKLIARRRPTPLTWGLIGLCLAVHVCILLLDKSGGQPRPMLTIVDLRVPPAGQVVSLFGWNFTWLTLPRAQLWRLLTPSVLHSDVLHLFFNMLWLRELGRIIESIHGARYLAALTLVSAALPNILQYEITGNPDFGGMSGVVYALLSLIWVRGKIDPRSRYTLPRTTAQFMLIWLVLGFFPQFGVASFCHFGGMLVGAVWAYVATRRSR